MKKLLLIFHTVKYLKFSQVFWQIYYRLKTKSTLTAYNTSINPEKVEFKGKNSSPPKYKGNNTFLFLNLEETFAGGINWDTDKFGKLWAYNLEYFDYLFQEDITSEEKLRLLRSFYQYSIEKRKILEPYPISLRIINILKFFSVNVIRDTNILSNVYQELCFLEKNLEYHILGNHLLENGFALLLGGAAFKNKEWESKAKRLLEKELQEQILEDGAHFELSPMYHKIIFFRILELIDWYSTYEEKDDGFLRFLENKAGKMLAFLQNIQFRNGDVPHFNDSAEGITYSIAELKAYSDLLQIEVVEFPLGESGYRTYELSDFELKVDAAQPAVSYQPGHAHADALSFVLYYQEKPFLVEQGTSTYQINERRRLERGSTSHNTVTINREDQSQVWGGFRLGRRARTSIIVDEPGYLKVIHDGYQSRFGVIHQREFLISDEIIIVDTLNKGNIEAEAFLHFSPGIFPYFSGNRIHFQDLDIKISLEGFLTIEIEEYLMANGFNCYQEAQRAVIKFKDKLSIRIYSPK